MNTLVAYEVHVLEMRDVVLQAWLLLLLATIHQSTIHNNI